MNLGAGNGAVALTAPLTWLTGGATYHFRAVGSNSAGLVYGLNQSFTTPVTFNPPVSTCTGGDPGEGLDLQGTFFHAVNIGGNGAPGLIGDANFTSDTSPNVSVTAPGGTVNTVDNWAAPNFGATA